MIPPVNMIQDESGGNEVERDKIDSPKSPNTSQQETKVSLSC